MSDQASKFFIGQLIHHRLFDYRGVVVGLDSTFSSTDEWYEMVAKSRPPKDKPWYHVLVHGAEHVTYVAQQNLEPYSKSEGIDHPLFHDFFDRFQKGRYVRDLHQ